MLKMLKMMKMRNDGEKLKILFYTVVIITLFVSTEVQSLTMGAKLIKVQVRFFFFLGTWTAILYGLRTGFDVIPLAARLT